MTLLLRTPKQLGAIVRDQRKKLGLSQKEVAQKCGTRQASISLLETGNPAIKLENLMTILAVLKLDLNVDQRVTATPRDIEDLF